MPVGSDRGPASLAYVTRDVIGEVTLSTRAVRDKKTGELSRQEVVLENPVVVFFLNGNAVLLSGKEAETRGFLRQPPILNFDAIDKPDSDAGRFKFAMRIEERTAAWYAMEQAVISRCVSKHGQPVPDGCRFSDKSLFLSGQNEGIAA